jgi:hypothetical protein
VGLADAQLRAGKSWARTVSIVRASSDYFEAGPISPR